MSIKIHFLCHVNSGKFFVYTLGMCTALGVLKDVNISKTRREGKLIAVAYYLRKY